MKQTQLGRMRVEMKDFGISMYARNDIEPNQRGGRRGEIKSWLVRIIQEHYMQPLVSYGHS